VIELIKAALDVDACRGDLSDHAEAFVADFEDAVARGPGE